VGARDRNIPEWRIAVIQDAPSEFAHQFMYPGGGFALCNALGWVQIVDSPGSFAASRTDLPVLTLDDPRSASFSFLAPEC
jgi:hypothetical protein